MDFRRYLSRICYASCSVLILLSLSGCTNSSKTSPQEFSKKSVHEFFSVLRSKGVRQAYFSTHPMFQTNTLFRTLVEIDTIYGLKQNQGIELSELSLDKNMIVSTGGNLKLTDSISVPFQARFSLDEQSLGVNPWKLTYVDFDMKKYFENQGMVEPDSEMILKIVKRYFLLFHRDLKRLQLEDFYETCSKFWRSKISLDQMEQLFRPLINERFLSQDFRNATFSLNYKSGLRNSGILVAGGNILGSSKIEFYMEFFYESGQFRPINFNLKQL